MMLIIIRMRQGMSTHDPVLKHPSKTCALTTMRRINSNRMVRPSLVEKTDQFRRWFGNSCEKLPSVSPPVHALAAAY